MPIPPSKIEPFPERNPFAPEFWDTLNTVGELAARYAEREPMIEETFARRESGGGGQPIASVVIPVLLNESNPAIKRTADGTQNYTGPLEYLYADWSELELTGTAGALTDWTHKDGGRSGTVDGPLTNLCEIENGSNTHGSGYRLIEIPDGFEIRPIPPRVLFVHAIPLASSPETFRYWFDMPNKLGGQCP